MNVLRVAHPIFELSPPTEVPTIPLPPRPEPRFTRSIDFAALPSAISCIRLFVASTLGWWGVRFMEADAELLAVEQVRHSVQTCGVTADVPLYELDYLNVIPSLRLLGFTRSIGIEVWDNAIELAALPAQYQEGELRGLALADARAEDWGSTFTPQGLVTWAELEVYDRAASRLPIRTPRLTTYPRPSEGVEDRRSQDADFLRRVRDGLERL